MPDLYLGLDIGTSGARAIAIDAAGTVRVEAKSAMQDHGANHRAPQVWWAAAEAALQGALSQVNASEIRSVAVDGTSGTMLAVDAELAPLGDGIMYNDPCSDQDLLDKIRAAAPEDSPALGASSALARAHLLTRLKPVHLLHQADWISARLSGQVTSDDNNALKTGYDLIAQDWPAWISETGLDLALLPKVSAPGTAIGPVTAEARRAFGFSADTQVVTGTTDGCASFIATGADQPGDGVSALGTTLTIKLLSDRPISAPEFGIYSHRVLGQWLAGGASNSGGGVLLDHFDSAQIAALSKRIPEDAQAQHGYYPLSTPGERFPIADPTLPPRMAPRPTDDTRSLLELLDGIAGIEDLAYGRLQELGAPALKSVRTVGGGAQNPAWTHLRARRLKVDMPAPASTEAAYGTALLARRGVT